MGRHFIQSILIPMGESASQAIDRLGYSELSAVQIPDNFEGDELAVESVAGDADNTEPEDSDFVPLYNDDGQEVVLQIPDKPIVIGVDKFVIAMGAPRWIRFVARSAGTPQVQAAERTLTLQVLH